MVLDVTWSFKLSQTQLMAALMAEKYRTSLLFRRWWVQIRQGHFFFLMSTSGSGGIIEIMCTFGQAPLERRLT